MRVISLISFIGNTIGPPSSDTPDQCFGLCANTPDCAGIVFDAFESQDNFCTMLSDPIQITPNNPNAQSDVVPFCGAVETTSPTTSASIILFSTCSTSYSTIFTTVTTTSSSTDVSTILSAFTTTTATLAVSTASTQIFIDTFLSCANTTSFQPASPGQVPSIKGAYTYFNNDYRALSCINLPTSSNYYSLQSNKFDLTSS
jgi:hypothetical protein